MSEMYTNVWQRGQYCVLEYIFIEDNIKKIYNLSKEFNIQKSCPWTQKINSNVKIMKDIFIVYFYS